MHKLHTLSILSLSLLIIMTGSTVSPALGKIQAAFPEQSPDLIKMIITIPSLVLIPFNLLSGKISQKISHKTLVSLGIGLYLLGGVGAAFCGHIYSLLLFRSILGAGIGLLLPLSASLIGTFFKGEDRKKMMGYSNAIANFGSILASLLSGFIALYHWRYIFFIYLSAIPVGLLALTHLPEAPKSKTISHQAHYINGKVLLLSLVSFILNIGFYSVIINLALFLENENLGTSSTAGIATAILTLAGFISGFMLHRVTRILSKLTVPTFIGIMGVGFTVISLPLYLTMVYIGVFLIGFGFGILKPLLFLKVTNITEKNYQAFSLSIVLSAFYLGKFASPIVLRYVRELYCTECLRFQFSFIGICFFMACLAAVGYGIYKRYKIKYNSS